MKATEELEHEHRVIERMLAVIELTVSKPGIHPDFFRKVLPFLREFLDKCHHAKEEDVLFPFMKEKKVKDSDSPIERMLVEHQLGRNYVQEIADANAHLAAGDSSVTPNIKNAAKSYIELLRLHIGKEDRVLYPMANRVFSGADNKHLLERFEKIEIERIGEGKHEAFLGLIVDLEKQTGITV